jgi:hypothetical protein
MGKTPNVFDVLTSFGHRIQEDNYSDFLAFILNPNSDKRLADRFLKSFVSNVVKKNNVSLDDVSVYREVSYIDDRKVASKKERYMDIEIHNLKFKSGIPFRICIECKTSSSSKSSQQLKDEYRLIKNRRDTINKDEKIYFLYLTPLHKNYKSALNKLNVDDKDEQVWITWNNLDMNNLFYKDDKEYSSGYKNVISIIDILDEVKKDVKKEKENNKDVEYPEIYRFFEDHLINDFIIRDSIKKTIGKESYKIIQYFDNQVKIFMGENEYIPDNKKKALEEIIDVFNLDIDLKNKNNTYQVAKLVIKELRNLNDKK